MQWDKAPVNVCPLRNCVVRARLLPVQYITGARTHTVCQRAMLTSSVADCSITNGMFRLRAEEREGERDAEKE